MHTFPIALTDAQYVALASVVRDIPGVWCRYANGYLEFNAVGRGELSGEQVSNMTFLLMGAAAAMGIKIPLFV